MVATPEGLGAGRKMFLVSSFSKGIVGNEAVYESWVSAVRSRNASPRLTYIPTAMYAERKDSSQSPGKQRQRTRREGRLRRDEICAALGGTCEAATLDLYDASIRHGSWAKDAEQALTQADCIFVDGGNTFWLSQCLKPYRDLFLSSDAVYVGVSAGAIVAGKDVSTALWKGWDDPTVAPEWSREGLGLVDSIFPHYTEEWADLVQSKNDQDDVFILDEEGALLVDQDGTRQYHRKPEENNV